MMGEYTHHMKASYSATDVDALIEILRRVPAGGMEIDLGRPDTERMLGWLTEAEYANYLQQQVRWGTYRNLFEQHLDYQSGGDSDPVRHWPDDMIKVLLVAWWTVVMTDTSIDLNHLFTQRSLDWACTEYNGFAEVLDVELI